MEPWGCFVAEEDNAKIVGAALAATWGTLGLLGPVAVLTHYHNQYDRPAAHPRRAGFFEENKATLHGAVTTRPAPSTWPLPQVRLPAQALLAVMSRALERPGTRPALPKPAARALTVRRFSALEETKKKAALPRFHRITNAVCKGMDLSKEVEIVDGLALGDTLLLERGTELAGFAIYHTPGVSEAPAGRST